MPLKDEEVQALMRRREVADWSVNQQLVEDLVRICLEKETDEDTRNALEMLRDLSSLLTTLRQDIDILFSEREELLRKLDVYQELEKHVSEEA